MKKYISLLLTLVMVLSLGTVSFAEGRNDSYADKLDVAPVVPKTYVVENGTAPAETFTYSFEGISYVNGAGETVANANIPAIDDVTIDFEAISNDTTLNAPITIDKTKYNLGVYTYKVTEKAGDTTGVTYSEEELYLVLSIVRDESSNKYYVGAMHYANAEGEKTKGFTNHYDAGSLSVTKNITGNMADMDKTFRFTVEFTAPAGTTPNSTIALSVNNGTATNVTFTNGTATAEFTLGHEDVALLSNIPEGVTYEVTENSEDAKDYDVDVDYKDNTQTIQGTVNETAELDEVVVTNDLNKGVDTGIIINNMPYILLLAAVALSVMMVIRRRNSAI